MAKAIKEPEPTPTTSAARAGTAAVADAPSATQTPAQAVQFPEVAEGPVNASGGQLDLLLDMDVSVAVILGQAQVPIRRLLQLGPGAVIPLGKPIEAPVELYIQGSKFAEGDVVVVDNHFGVRIRQIMSLDNGGPGGQG
jgi:flagellar motor switch protein FliN/FliY